MAIRPGLDILERGETNRSTRQLPRTVAKPRALAKDIAVVASKFSGGTMMLSRPFQSDL
jgi:hypothetical protein